MTARPTAQSGFSLIEVLITVGILTSMTLAVAMMLRSGLEVKSGLSEKAKVVHRLSVSMTKVADDLQHTFFVSTKDTVRNGIGRRTKSVFKIDKSSSGDKLEITTRTHRPMVAESHESDLTYVVYELRDSKVASGRKDLMRGEAKYIPLDLKDDPPMQILARNIKSFTLEAWTGEKWSRDYWDTGRGDTRNLLPRLVKVTIEAWTEDRTSGDGQDERVDELTDKLVTVINIPEALDYLELKEAPKSINWGGF